jgi:hypoxanthine-DNA glycosylase
MGKARASGSVGRPVGDEQVEQSLEKVKRAARTRAKAVGQPAGLQLLSPQLRPSDVPLLEGFPPVVAADTHTMVFGSFPGVASLSATQYYAHPQNQFWRLLGAVLDEPLPALPYDERLVRLLAHRIGVWDVLAACERTGSLDVAIRNASPNDFAALRRHAPSLRKVCFNGKTAGRFEAVMQEAGYETLVLPSSSPAHAMLSFEQKLAVWRQISTRDGHG